MKYKIPKLNEQTTQADQTKLVSALKGVQGVQDATLHLGSHEVDIVGRDAKDPVRKDISAAASKAGFPLAGK